MSKRPRRNHSPAFKAGVALADVFGSEPAASEPAVDVTVLHAKIGELTLANDFLAGALGSASDAGCGASCQSRARSVAERKTMIGQIASALSVPKGSIAPYCRTI